MQIEDECAAFIFMMTGRVNRPKVERTACTTNQECALEGDAAAMCSLVGDFSLGTSYGSIPCNLCTSSQPLCLVTDSSSASNNVAGVCACMQQRPQLQSCSRADLAMRVVPDASQLCAVSLHAGASSRSMSALYDWNFLAATPCVLISMGNAYCYEVGGYGLMVVGHGVVRTVSPIGGRRLLQDGVESIPVHESIMMQLESFQSGWNHTKEPCRTLASEFQRVYVLMNATTATLEGWMDTQWRQHGGLSMMEVMQLEQACIHWRVVGRSMIQSLNLTSMAAATNDCCSHVFMSLGDLVSVVASSKGAGLEMLQRLPEVAMAWLRGTSVYADVLKLADVARQHAVVTYLDSLWSEYFAANGTNTSSSSWRGANATEVSMLKKFIAQHRRQVALFDTYATEILGRGDPGVKTKPILHAAVKDEHAEPVKPGRKLLQTDQSVVDAYSSLVASTSGFSNIAVSASRAAASAAADGKNIPLVTETWLEGPFGWPPRYSSFYSHHQGIQQCAAADAALQSALDVAEVIRTYYASDFASKVSVPPWDFASNIPKLSTSVPADPAGVAGGEVLFSAIDTGTWAPAFFQSVLDGIESQAPWLQDAAASFFVLDRGGNTSNRDALNVGNLVHDSLVCNFDNIMFCGRQASSSGSSVPSRQRRNLLVCFVAAILFWGLIGAMLSYLPGGVGTILQVLVYASMWVLVPGTTVQLSYGMAVTCFPLVPTCLLQDLILGMQAALPISIRWPDSLQTEAGCMDRLANASAGQRQHVCMRSCRDAPFHFQRYVFVMCVS